MGPEKYGSSGSARVRATSASLSLEDCHGIHGKHAATFAALAFVSSSDAAVEENPRLVLAHFPQPWSGQLNQDIRRRLPRKGWAEANQVVTPARLLSKDADHSGGGQKRCKLEGRRGFTHNVGSYPLCRFA